MSNYNIDSLFGLIKSLNRSEKRQFKLYVNRIAMNSDSKFLALFNALDKMNEYNEEIIIAKNITTKQQLSNLKAHLYKQILTSLRMNPTQQNERMQIREQFDFATILYQKGLHKQSLKILDKAKSQALKMDEKTIAYDILELEKIIESQFITRSISGRADQLIEESKLLSNQNLQASKLSNLSLKLYSTLLENGYAKNDDEIAAIKLFFFKETNKITINELKFKEQLWYYKANVWLYMLIQEPDNAQIFAQKWVELFYTNPQRINSHPVWFLKGNTYLLKILYLKKSIPEFKHWMQKIDQHIDYLPHNENVEALLFITKYNTKLNYSFINPTETISPFFIKDIIREIKYHLNKIDQHHISILYLKIASYYFLNKDYENSIKFCYKILNSKQVIQEDLHFYTHVLMMMNMYDSENDHDLDKYALKARRICLRMKNKNIVTQKISDFFIELNEIYPNEKIRALKNLKQFLIDHENQNTLKRSINYINLKTWINEKIDPKTIK